MQCHHNMNPIHCVKAIVTLSLIIALRLREKCAWWHMTVHNRDLSIRLSLTLTAKEWMNAINDDMEFVWTNQV